MSDSRERNEKPNSTEEYLEGIKRLVDTVVSSPDYRDEAGYISDAAWGKLVDGGMLSAALLERDPSKRQDEIMEAIRYMSNRDISFGLSYGITVALVIFTAQRYAQTEELRQRILDILRAGGRMGLAITESGKSGTAALDMDSNYEIDKGTGKTRLKFSKRLQGLSGYQGMIVAAVDKSSSRKKVSLYFVPQQYITTEVTPMAGLSGIRYGVNSADVVLDTKEHLLVEFPREGMNEFQDIFNRSRMLFVGMTLGHLDRSLAEAENYATRRMIEGRPQREIPAVQGALRELRARQGATEAVFDYVLKYRDKNGQTLTDGDTLSLAMEAGIVKSITTHWAIQGAQIWTQLAGGIGYYQGGPTNDLVNILPFHIFEGPELFLDNQIARTFLSPTRVEGKFVFPGFMANPDTNFHDYFFQAVRYRPMFDRAQIIQNLNDWTAMMLTQITPLRAHVEYRGAIGAIVERLFALGCLNKEDQVEAISMVNREICQLCQYFTP